MSDRDLSAHVIKEVVEIGPMHHVGQQLPVHFFHLRPVGSMHVRHVEIIALIAPALVEDLFEFLPGLEIHTQRNIETPLSCLRRIAISINKKQLWSSGTASCGTASATTA